MMKVFHAGYDIISTPDIHRGRKNADFGQGFYLSDSYEFSSRWVRQKNGMDIIVNMYELDEEDLVIKRFDRDREWFSYVFSNRRAMPDSFEGTDMIIGPIANDTIYNTMGMITSGYLSDDEAVELLCVGPLYRQIVLKTQNAADHLKFISYEKLSGDSIELNSKILRDEEEKYLKLFAEAMQRFL
ncbi:DUF3990 domain-containing protein [Butyrivibrio sp. JL13D10]|uniref:DUF3990 domain-containing protein n=1 Tax=Butyrivibrio sp. JL13D10 TaxID=3236815 RepID=UPI0038B5C249